MSNPTNNSSIREEILGLADAVVIPNNAKDAEGTVVHMKLTDIETLITTHTDQILDELLSKLPEERVKTTEKTYKEYDRNNPRHRYITGVDVGYNEALIEVKQTIKLYRGHPNAK